MNQRIGRARVGGGCALVLAVCTSTGSVFAAPPAPYYGTGEAPVVDADAPKPEAKPAPSKRAARKPVAVKPAAPRAEVDAPLVQHDAAGRFVVLVDADGKPVQYRLVVDDWPVAPAPAADASAEAPDDAAPTAPVLAPSPGDPIPGDEPPLVDEALLDEEATATPSAVDSPPPASLSQPKPGTTASASAIEPTSDAPPPTTVMGSVVLGLLPYTIAEGAFGIGTSVGLDKMSEHAAIAFGPSVALGVTPWCTLGAAVPFASSEVGATRETGLGNASISAQLAFFDDPASGITLSATPGVAFPAPSEAASQAATPDVKVSGAINFGKVAVDLTARGRVDVPTDGTASTPGLSTALSLILVNDVIAPFLEGGFDLADAEVAPMGAAGVNWAPGGGALLTMGVPVVFDGESVAPGFAFTAYFETSLFGGKSEAVAATSSFVAR